jgi:hypothetical protein
VNWFKCPSDELKDAVTGLSVLHFVSLLALYAFRDDVENPNVVFLVA